MSLRDRLLACGVAVVWGVNFVVIEWGRGDVPPLLFLALRFVVVLVPLVAILPRPDLPWRVLLGIGALLSLGQFAFLYLAMAAGLAPGLAALVLQAQVIVTVLSAGVVLRERPTGAQWLGVAVGTLGLVVVGLGRGGSAPLLGLGLCLLGALSWGLGNVLTRWSGAPGGLPLVVWSSVVVPGPLLVLSLVSEGPGGVVDGLAAIDVPAVLSTLYTAVLASLVGYGVFSRLLARNPAGQVVPHVLLAPPVAMVAAWLAFDQVPTRGEALGAVLVVLGVGLASVPRRTSAPGLGEGRPGAVEGGEGGLDAARGEVGAPLAHLLGGAERDGADLARLEDRGVEHRRGTHAAVEDQAQGVVPAAPWRQPVGEQQRAGVEGESELLLDLADDRRLG